ncbi:MAG: putative Ig domain-containing protein [Verrucomicrobiales bacterium]|nr:putative Ig domain-containing protein [Verrucomicrobiales bacterium]
MSTMMYRSMRLPSLVVAVALQVLPLTRAALPFARSAGQVLAIVFRWATGAAAAMGGIQAVSGASTTVTSAKTAKGTNGVPFSFRLTTAPDQAGYWTASGLPLGLSLSGTSGKPLWRIQGTPTETGQFQVKLTAKEKSTSKGDRVVSATMVINVLAGVAPPSISTQPLGQKVVLGAEAVFQVTAAGSESLTYQWRKDGTAIAGAVAPTLTLSAVTADAAGVYDVIVTGSGGAVTSEPATLTVLVPPTISTPPLDVTVQEGAAWQLSVEATGTAPFSYQWQFQGTDLTGETAAVLARAAATTNEAGAYQVIVRNAAGSVTSHAANVEVTVKPVVTAPHLTVGMTSPGVLEVRFDAVAGGVYHVERSSDFVAWENHKTLGPSVASGAQTVEVPITSADGGGFIRVRVAP